MKIILYLIALLVHFSLTAQSQTNYKITYELNYKPDTTDLNKIKKERMLLYTNGKNSLFLSNGRVLKDSMRGKFGFGDISSPAYKAATKAAETDFQFRILKNPVTGVVYHHLRIVVDNYHYTENPKFNWQIHNETKTILGYSTQKATTQFGGRSYTVWFSPVISIPDGPYKFFGLPGLILEATSDDDDYKFVVIGIEKTSFFPIKEIPYTTSVEAPKEKLQDLQKEFDEDPIGFMNNWEGQSGNTLRIGLKGDAKKKYYDQYGKGTKTINNPIELIKN